MRNLLISFSLMFLISNVGPVYPRESGHRTISEYHLATEISSNKRLSVYADQNAPFLLSELSEGKSLRLDAFGAGHTRVLDEKGTDRLWEVGFAAEQQVFFNNRMITVNRYVGGLRNSVASGKGTLIFENGKRIFVGSFINGYADGVGAVFNDNYDLLLIGRFKNGNLHGKVIDFYEGRYPKKIAYIEAGKLVDGDYYEYSDNSGESLPSEVFIGRVIGGHKNGNWEPIPIIINSNDDLIVVFGDMASYVWKSNGHVLTAEYDQGGYSIFEGFKGNCEITTSLGVLSGRCSSPKNLYPIVGGVQYTRHSDGMVLNGEVVNGTAILENNTELALGKIDLHSEVGGESDQYVVGSNTAFSQYLCQIAKVVDQHKGCTLSLLGMEISLGESKRLNIKDRSGRSLPFFINRVKSGEALDDELISWLKLMKAEDLIDGLKAAIPYNSGNWHPGVRYDLSLPYFSDDHVGLPTRSGRLRRDLIGQSHYGATRCIEEIEGLCTSHEIHIGADYEAAPDESILAPVKGRIVASKRHEDGSNSIKLESKEVIIRIFEASLLPSHQVGMAVNKGEPIGIANDTSVKYPGIPNYIHMRILDKKEAFTFSRDGRSMVLPE